MIMDENASLHQYCKLSKTQWERIFVSHMFYSEIQTFEFSKENFIQGKSIEILISFFECVAPH